MADIAAIFNWTPAALVGLSLGELMGWRARAIDRAEALGMLRKA